MTRYSLAVFYSGRFAYVLRFATLADASRVARVIRELQREGKREPMSYKLTIA